MADPARVTYASCGDVTPEKEASVLAAFYRFVLDCHAEKKAASQLFSAPIRKPSSFEPIVDSLTEEGEGDR